MESVRPRMVRVAGPGTERSCAVHHGRRIAERAQQAHTGVVQPRMNTQGRLPRVGGAARHSAMLRVTTEPPG